MNIKYVEKPI
jgi:hypothetical protein